MRVLKGVDAGAEPEDAGSDDAAGDWALTGLAGVCGAVALMSFSSGISSLK
jgi:hypothetical protein|tara:strand:+ start:77121 stop:77273 length:153 start_codon:yes stop_codon:yes gene_type:complete